MGSKAKWQWGEHSKAFAELKQVMISVQLLWYTKTDMFILDTDTSDLPLVECWVGCRKERIDWYRLPGKSWIQLNGIIVQPEKSYWQWSCSQGTSDTICWDEWFRQIHASFSMAEAVQASFRSVGTLFDRVGSVCIPDWASQWFQTSECGWNVQDSGGYHSWWLHCRSRCGLSPLQGMWLLPSCPFTTQWLQFKEDVEQVVPITVRHRTLVSGQEDDLYMTNLWSDENEEARVSIGTKVFCGVSVQGST